MGGRVSLPHGWGEAFQVDSCSSQSKHFLDKFHIPFKAQEAPALYPEGPSTGLSSTCSLNFVLPLPESGQSFS